MSRPFYTSTDLNAYPDIKEYAPEAYEAYEALTEKAILCAATKDLPDGETAKHAKRPRICSSMARTRIACAGVRKTRDESKLGIDNSYSICFA